MKIQFIGTGNAFCLNKTGLYQSNLMIHADDGSKDKFLLDCGSDVRNALDNEGYSVNDITHCYISHLHSDHVGGLEWLALSSYFNPHCSRPHLYAAGDLLQKIWKWVLQGGLRTLEKQDPKLTNFFECHRLQAGKDLEWHELLIKPVQTVHVASAYEHMENFGLMITDTYSGKKIFWTADCQFAPVKFMLECFNEADLVLHDCETTMPPVPPSGVHAHFNELKQLPLEIKKKMVLYHYTSHYTQYDALSEGFIGFAKQGQVISIDRNGVIDIDSVLDLELD